MNPWPAKEAAAEERPPGPASSPADSSTRAFDAVDRLTMGYLVFTLVLVAIRGDRMTHASAVAAVNGALLLLVWWLSRLRRADIGSWRTVADWYPLALFVVFFEEIGSLIHAIVGGWHDTVLIAADRALVGVDPTVWMERFAGYWTTEYMQFSYFMYFPLTAGAAIWLRLRYGRGALGLLFLASAVAYYSCYISFLIFPVEGPYHTLRHLQQVELHGGPFTALMEWIERYGRVHGGVFPSAHVAGSVVSWLAVRHFSPRAAMWLAPLVLSIMVATVYGLYHYAVDVPAGALVGLAGFLGARHWTEAPVAFEHRGAVGGRGPRSRNEPTRVR